MAGIAIRDRAHLGLIHQKSTVLHSQGMTIFGSSNWTSPSAGTSDSGTPPHPNSQDEHNYFTKRSDFYTFFRDQFERKWNNLTGIGETKPFVPLPPDTPVNKSPANGATGLANSVTLAWDPKEFGHIYDVSFGTTSNPPLIAANLALGPRESASQLTKFKFVVSELAPGDEVLLARAEPHDGQLRRRAGSDALRRTEVELGLELHDGGRAASAAPAAGTAAIGRLLLQFARHDEMARRKPVHGHAGLDDSARRQRRDARDWSAQEWCDRLTLLWRSFKELVHLLRCIRRGAARRTAIVRRDRCRRDVRRR